MFPHTQNSPAAVGTMWDIKGNHLIDPQDPWMPCGDAANTLGGRSLYFQGWFLYQEAKAFNSLSVFLFINQKSSPFASLQRFPLKWHSLFNFTFILLFTSKINILEFPVGLHKQVEGILYGVCFGRGDDMSVFASTLGPLAIYFLIFIKK